MCTNSSELSSQIADVANLKSVDVKDMLRRRPHAKTYHFQAWQSEKPMPAEEGD
jgi:hypothetical protein